jgi:ribose transport system ATP-binding protein
VATPVFALSDITKRFGPVTALDHVHMEVYAGEVHALIGENGAGKSTLVKIMSGAHRPDTGSLRINGRPVRFSGPRGGRDHGIAMMYQELALAPHLSVAQNVVLGIEHSRWGLWRSRHREIREALATLGREDIDPDAPVHTLSIAQKQMVEIARALVSRARIVIMDEPTSSLTREDTRALFTVLQRLVYQGVAVVYISHFLEEVFELAHSYTVLRDGRRVAHGSIRDSNLQSLIRAMVGRSMVEMYPRSDRRPGRPVCRVAGLTRRDHAVRDVSLAVHTHEVLGIAGLVGAGRTELLRCLFGLHPFVRGSIFIHDTHLDSASRTGPALMRRLGMNLLSENRREEGLAVHLSIRDNATLASLSSRVGPRFTLPWMPPLLDTRATSTTVEQWRTNLDIRCADIDQPVDALSGGNQQKVAMARLCIDNSDLLLLDEPTRGIDVGSKAAMYQWIHHWAAQGKAVIIAGSYLPELFGICDRLAVMHRGTLSPIRPKDQWSEESLMQWATTGTAPHMTPQDTTA